MDEMRVSPVRQAVRALYYLCTLTSSQVILHWGDRDDLWVCVGWRGHRNHSRHTGNVVWIHRNLRRRSTLCHLPRLVYWAGEQQNDQPSIQSGQCLRRYWWWTWSLIQYYLFVNTDGVVDSSRCQDSSSSGRSSSRSEDNTGTSRSPTVTGTRCCPGLQIPQTPTLEYRHTCTWFCVRCDMIQFRCDVFTAAGKHLIITEPINITTTHRHTVLFM